MWESAAKPADALGKERVGLGDREVMRFMAMTRQPGNPTDSPLAWAHCSLAASAPALLLRTPRAFMWGGGLYGGHGDPYRDWRVSPSDSIGVGMVQGHMPVLWGPASTPLQSEDLMLG